MLAQSHGTLASDCIDVDELLVELPPEWSNFFEEGGYVGTTFDEHRVNARLRVRTETSLRMLYSVPFAQRKKTRGRVLVKDMSRKGIGILFHIQLWPTEKFSLELHGRIVVAVVVRCRKVGPRCFEIGAIIETVQAAT